VEEFEQGLQIQGSGTGKRNLDVAYLTSGNGWQQSYIFKINGEVDNGNGDLESWGTARNFEQEDWNSTTLTFSIGNPHFISYYMPYYYNVYATKSGASAAEAIGVPAPAAPPSVDTLAATGYWRYRLSPVSLKAGETGSFQLFKKRANYERRMLWDSSFSYNAWSSSRKTFTINNSGPELWGTGTMQVFDSTTLLGEDQVQFAAKGDSVEVYISDVPELKGRKEMLNSEVTRNGDDRVTTYDYRITMQSGLNRTVGAIVRDQLPYADKVEVVKSSHGYEKKPNNAIEWKPLVKGEGKLEITYTVKTTDVGYYANSGGPIPYIR
jgi:hypothetical protein